MCIKNIYLKKLMFKNIYCILIEGYMRKLFIIFWLYILNIISEFNFIDACYSRKSTRNFVPIRGSQDLTRLFHLTDF